MPARASLGPLISIDEEMPVSRIEAVIFDMDGLLIDSEPLWTQGEHDVFSSLGIDVNAADIPETLGLRIDLVVKLWYQRTPWQGASQEEVTERIIRRVIELVRDTKPLLPGVEHALKLCRQQGMKIGLASASPLYMLNDVLEMFNISQYFDAVVSAEALPYSKPHPEVYLNAAHALGVDPLNCVTLEDSFNGMIATKAARMRSIVVPAPENINDPRWALADVKLNNLNELSASDIQP